MEERAGHDLPKRSLRSVRGGSSVSALAAGWAADSRGVREITDDGLPADSVESLFEDHRGQIWVTTQSGVAILKSDRFFPVSSVPYGLVFAIAGDRAGNVWMSHEEGLFRLRQERVVERLPWGKLGRREPATALLHDGVRGGLWLGFRDGGVAFLEDGRLSGSYAGNEGLAEGLVGGFQFCGSGRAHSQGGRHDSTQAVDEQWGQPDGAYTFSGQFSAGVQGGIVQCAQSSAIR
jgi:Two component regulator propeller